MAKFLAEIIVLGTQLIGRAFTKAVREEIQASQEAARRLGRSGKTREHVNDTKLGMSLEEAKQILNVSDDKFDPEQVRNKYTALFNANEKSNGGSFYLQSKVFRARERIDYEIEQQILKQNQDDSNQSTPPTT